MPVAADKDWLACQELHTPASQEQPLCTLLWTCEPLSSSHPCGATFLYSAFVQHTHTHAHERDVVCVCVGVHSRALVAAGWQ